MKNALFESISFTIIEYGVDISRKRAKLIIDLIEKNGGRYIEKDLCN